MVPLTVLLPLLLLLLLPLPQHTTTALSLDLRSINKKLTSAVGEAHTEIQSVTTFHDYVTREFNEMRLNYRDTMTVLSKTGSNISRNGLLYTSTLKHFTQNFSGNTASYILRYVPTPKTLKLSCPYLVAPACDNTSLYRTVDGSCNNLDNPLWGKALTPLERMRPPFYHDSVYLPRNTSVENSPLPGPRDISVLFHSRNSSLQDQNTTHLAAVFGQFLMRDLAYVPSSQGENGKSYDCCKFGFRSGHICMPIDVSQTDPYFPRFNRKCLSYARSAAAPPLDCRLGPREQLNQNSHYLDLSQVYGSDASTTATLRTRVTGELKTSKINAGTMMPQDRFNNAGCSLNYLQGQMSYCFLAGDDRVNENPMLQSLHALFLREHNRVAQRLSSIHSDWDDEKLFQESRRIVIAEMQHIVYNEYLPHMLGPHLMSKYNLNVRSQGYTSYDRSQMGAVYNVFAAAAGQYSPSMMRSKFSVGNVQLNLSANYLRSDVFYQNPARDVVSDIVKGLTTDRSNSLDRHITDELTNKYLQTLSGSGIDIAAFHIQRGRDHGLVSYPMWTIGVGKPQWANFQALTNHTVKQQLLLASIYRNVFDLDLWTGGISENPVFGGKVGPTFGDIIGKQFHSLKYGDRFWYEHNERGAFNEDQLEQIRKVTLSELICANTDITSIQRDVFSAVSDSNPLVECGSLPKVDLCKWGPPSQWLAWGPWSLCFQKMKLRSRECKSNSKIVCPCDGSFMEFRSCQRWYVPPAAAASR